MTTARPIIMAPGVQFQEIDISQYIRELTNSKLAVVLKAQKGEKNKNLLLTSLPNALHTLGIPSAAFPGLQVIRDYFNAGGGRVNAVVVSDGTDEYAATEVALIDDDTAQISVPTSGSYYNNQFAQISYGSLASQIDSTSHTFVQAGDEDGHVFEATNLPLVAGSVVIKFDSTIVARDSGAGLLVFESAYDDYYGGTVDYITGEVTIVTEPLISDNATTVRVLSNYWTSFNIQVKQQVLDSDNNTINAPFTVETHRGLTLANMVDRLQYSQYISVLGAFTAFPVAGLYQFSGGSDGTAGITDADYIGNELGESPTGLRIFARPDQIDINLLAIPKVSQSLAVRQAMLQVCEVDRFDTLAILDPPPSLTVQEVADWANGDGDYSSYDTIDSTYAACYYPYYTSYNNVTNEHESTPPSAMAVGAFARSNPWEAPAGPNRGRGVNITNIDTILNARDREFLAENRINPISDINGIGPMVAGQMTMALSASSLDRVAARMMLMRIEKAVLTALFTLLFEPNTPRTWNRAINIVQPYLNSLTKRQRIYTGEFICDRSTNTDDIINNNIMAATCYLQLLKHAEIIVVSFVVDKFGGRITENLVSSINQV